MIQRLRLTVFLLSLCPAIALSQMGTIRGKVIDCETGEALPGANIVVVGTTLGAATNAQGEFIISIPPGVYIVEASRIGYKKISFRNVRANTTATTTLSFQLVGVQSPGACIVTPIRLSADYSSRSLTMLDTAVYNIEVMAIAANKQSVALSVVPNPNIQFELSAEEVETPALVQLKVYPSVNATLGRHTLQLIGASSGFTDELQIGTTLVAATALSPKFILETPFKRKLEKNILQSLVGTFVPAKVGKVEVFLKSPSSKLDTVITRTDERGQYNINHSFEEHGHWQAIAVWRAIGQTVGPSFVLSDTISFDVKPRPDHLALSSKILLDSAGNKVLRIRGRIATDKMNPIISVQVTNQDNESVLDRQLSPDASGVFSVDLLGQSPGIYRIRASAVASRNPTSELQNLGKILYASATPINLSNANDLIANREIETNLDVPAGYAVIVVGFSPSYRDHFNMARRVRDDLILNRGFREEDIKFVTLREDSPDRSNHVYDIASLKTEVRTFLQRKPTNDTHFSVHQGLLFFWIGNSSSVPSFVSGSGTSLTPADIAAFYDDVLGTGSGNSLWPVYNDVVILHAGDYSGLLVDKVLPNLRGVSESNYVISSLDPYSQTEDYSILCSFATFSSYFLEATNANLHVLSAFKHGWARSVTTKKPVIYLKGKQEDRDKINIYGTDQGPDPEPLIGYGINFGEQPEPIVSVEGSPVGSPQLAPQGRVHVYVDNPSQYAVLQVSLKIEPPQSTGSPACYVNLTSEGSTSHWSTQISYPDSGLYSGTVFVLYEDIDNQIRASTTTFERFRHLIPVTGSSPTIPEQQEDILLDLGLTLGVDWTTATETSDLTGSIGLHFFTLGKTHENDVVVFPILSIGGDADKQWISLSPAAVNVGYLATRGHFLGDLWLHGGIGYIFNDNTRFSKQGDIILFGGIRTRL